MEPEDEIEPEELADDLPDETASAPAGEDDPLAWTQSYGGPDKARDMLKNLESMQREAHQRNEEARRLRDEAREFELRAKYQQQYVAEQARPQKKLPWDEPGEDGEFDLAKAFRGLHSTFEENLEKHNQRVAQLEAQLIQDRVQERVRSALAGKQYRDLREFGGEDLLERMTARAFREGRSLDDVPRLAREWADSETERIRSMEKKWAERQLQSKSKARAEHIPSSGKGSGGQRARPSKPNDEMVDWSLSGKALEANQRAVKARIYREAGIGES